MEETKIASDGTEKHKHPISRKKARVMVDCVGFCRMLRKRKMFPNIEEISHIAIENTALSMVVSEEWRRAYLSQDGWLIKLGYIEQLDEKHYGETYYRLTGKDIDQKEQARAEYVRLCSGSS